MIDAEYAQAQLRVLWLSKGNGTLLNALQARLTSLIGKTQDGTFLASTSGNGISASFFSAKDTSPSDMVKLVNGLIRLYEKYSTVIGDTLSGPAKEESIYNSMLADDSLAGDVTEYTGDFSGLHQPYTA